VDCEKLAPFIKKFLKNAVADGKLIQTKGKGASGSFKFPAASKNEGPEKKVVKPKAKTVAKKSAAQPRSRSQWPRN
jgi:histone H1/5